MNLSQEFPVVEWEIEIRKEKWPMKFTKLSSSHHGQLKQIPPWEMMTEIMKQTSEFSQYKDKDTGE